MKTPDQMNRTYRRVGRQMRFFAIAWPVLICGLTIYNWRDGVGAAPWWFYTLGLIGCVAAWFFGGHLLARIQRRS